MCKGMDVRAGCIWGTERDAVQLEYWEQRWLERWAGTNLASLLRSYPKRNWKPSERFKRGDKMIIPVF